MVLVFRVEGVRVAQMNCPLVPGTLAQNQSQRTHPLE